MIGLVLALLTSGPLPGPLTICVQGALDPVAVHDAFSIEARKVGRSVHVVVGDRCEDAEVVVAIDTAAVVTIGTRATTIDLARVPGTDRPQEIARAVFAVATPASDDVPIVDEALTPLPRVPVRRVVVRRPAPAPPDRQSRVFAGLGVVSRGEQWLADVELGGWLPVADGLALGMRMTHVPEHTIVGELTITRLEVTTDITLEARVRLVDDLGLAFQIGGGLVWRRTGFGEEAATEVVGAGLGGLELRYDLDGLPLYVALAVQGTIFSGGKDYEVFIDPSIVHAPAAPRGAFGASLRVGARW